MSRRFSEKITTDQLADKIVRALEQRRDYDQEEMTNHLGPKIGETGEKLLTLINENYSLQGALKSLTETVEDDLRKVEFDTENMAFEKGEGFNGGKTGFRTLANGLSLLGVTAGGDWESPVYFIVYWDGKELRGYIPTDGNKWNTDTSLAYGNDDEADTKNCRKRFGVDDCMYATRMSQAKMDADIASRIAFSDEPKEEPNLKPVRQPKLDGELAFTVAELVGRCSGSAKCDSRVLYRMLKEICIERNDLENAAIFRDKERRAK